MLLPLLQLQNCWFRDTDGVRQQGGDGGLVLIGLCVEKRLVLK